MAKSSGKAATKKHKVDDEPKPQFRFDYSVARPNRFAGRVTRLVSLDPDVAAVFRTSESVNAVLRALIATMPKSEM